MSIQFYKANQAMKGCACGLSFNSKDHSYFVSLATQDGWNAGSRTGSFKNGAKCNLKFSLREVGGMLRALEQNETFSMFHKSATAQTQIKLAPYIAKSPETGADVQKGYGLAVFRTDLNSGVKTNFLMPFDFAEGVVFREHLKFALEHCFTATYALDKKNYLDSKKAKDAPESVEEDAKPAPKAESTTEDEW